MTAPERSRRSLDPSVRGILVLAAVVVVGLLLLAKAAPSSSTTIATRNHPGPSLPPHVTTPVTTRPTTTTPTTQGAVHPVGQVKVAVLNATGGKVKFASSANTKKVVAKGYATLPPGDTTTRPTSTVYFAPGYQADAVAVGAVLNIPASAVVAVPSPPPAPSGAQANVIVLLGQDTPA